jgi:hypothetical protein
MTKVKHIIEVLTKNYEPTDDIIFEFWGIDYFPDVENEKDWAMIVDRYENGTDEGRYLLERVGNFIDQLIYQYINTGETND